MSDLSGVFAASVTPFTEDDQVDHTWMRLHLRWLRAQGADGVVPMGTTGEGPSLSVDERKAMIDTAVAAAEGLTVIPGTGCASLPETIELTRYAFQAGAATALVLPPFYYKQPPLEGLLAFFRRLMDAVLEPGQGVLLYHFPRMSAVPITHELLHGLEESHPACVWGVKDSSADQATYQAFRQEFPDLRVFVGSDRLIASAFADSCAGVITSNANVIPNLLQAARRAVAAGEDITTVQAPVDAVKDLTEGYPTVTGLKLIVEALVGLPHAYSRPPHVELTREQRYALLEALPQVGLLPALA